MGVDTLTIFCLSATLLRRPVVGSMGVCPPRMPKATPVMTTAARHHVRMSERRAVQSSLPRQTRRLMRMWSRNATATVARHVGTMATANVSEGLGDMALEVKI